MRSRIGLIVGLLVGALGTFAARDLVAAPKPTTYTQAALDAEWISTRIAALEKCVIRSSGDAYAKFLGATREAHLKETAGETTADPVRTALLKAIAEKIPDYVAALPTYAETLKVAPAPWQKK